MQNIMTRLELDSNNLEIDTRAVRVEDAGWMAVKLYRKGFRAIREARRNNV